MLSAELGVEPVIDWLPSQAGDVQRTFASVSKARSILGYAPATSMEQGIRSFVEWLRSQPVT